MDTPNETPAGVILPTLELARTSAARHPSPLNQDEDPWRKSSVLTLDGGGIRGYASLWVLKLLMDAVGRQEKAHEDPHQSSFEPNTPQRPIPTVSAERLQTRSTEHHDGPSRVHTECSGISSRSRASVFRRRRSASRPPLPNGISPQSSDPESLVAMSECFLPCHYFDYIGGTSTGGLNAIMLGRLRMSVEECLDQYPRMAENVFSGTKRYLTTRIMRGSSTRYLNGHLEREIQNIVKRRTPADVRAVPLQRDYNFNRYHSPHDLCKTVVIANEDDGHASRPYLFRTYEHCGNPGQDAVKNPGPAHQHEIWKVARATSAAPTYFDPIAIDGKEYFDGGIGNNNPIVLILEEVASKADTTRYNEAVDIVVSVGAGLKPSKRLRAKHRFPRVSSWKPVKKLAKILDRVKNACTDAERAHREVERIFHHIGFDRYYRWNCGEEVGGLGLDEWHPNAKGNRLPTAKFIEQAVKNFMSQEGRLQKLEECAEQLVRLRRERLVHRPEDGRSRRRTHCTLLRCPYCHELLEDRVILKAHIIQTHPAKLTKDIRIDTLVQQIDETFPVFPGGPF